MSNIITIDGPTASGKTTMGSKLASRLGYQFIDSGSIYRAGCYYLLRHGLPVEDDLYAANVLKELKLSFILEDDNYIVKLDGTDITQQLDTPEVTELVPIVGGRPEVRRVVKDKQHELVFAKDTVITGRDVGSEIFPLAPVKFYLTASPEIRALRRFKQLQQKTEVSYDEILESIVRRDQIDSTRKVSPSRAPKDAVTIDTGEISMDTTLGLLHGKTLERLKERQLPEGNYTGSREML